MFSFLTNKKYSVIFLSLMLTTIFGLSGCDSEPPTLMKASKQFDSDKIRDEHVAHMRTNHMDALVHKRDETMYKGIRTEMHSLKACINCHVPEQHNGKVLRHTDPEHFCSTCHGYVAAQLDCFQCHVDHPVKDNQSASKDANPQNAHLQPLQQPGVAGNTETGLANTLDERTLAQNKVSSQVVNAQVVNAQEVIGETASE